MPVTNYYSLDGEIIGEKVAGGQRVDYLTDALGSVTATLDQSSSVLNTYRYKPYGGLLAKTGAAADPAFTWVGSQGYKQTNKKYSDVYVRARHYDSTNARWTSKDPIGFGGGGVNFYRYVNSAPVLLTDPMGLLPYKECRACGGPRLRASDTVSLATLDSTLTTPAYSSLGAAAKNVFNFYPWPANLWKKPGLQSFLWRRAGGNARPCYFLFFVEWDICSKNCKLHITEIAKFTEKGTRPECRAKSIPKNADKDVDADFFRIAGIKNAKKDCPYRIIYVDAPGDFAGLTPPNDCSFVLKSQMSLLELCPKSDPFNKCPHPVSHTDLQFTVSCTSTGNGNCTGSVTSR